MLEFSQLPSDDAILDGYLSSHRTARSGDAEEPWPVDAFQILIARDPDRAWRLICRLIQAAPNDVLPDIGVGELEEFISRHASQYIDSIEAQATADQRFVVALANVWITHGMFAPEVERRLVNASRGSITVLKDDSES